MPDVQQTEISRIEAALLAQRPDIRRVATERDTVTVSGKITAVQRAVRVLGYAARREDNGTVTFAKRRDFADSLPIGDRHFCLRYEWHIGCMSLYVGGPNGEQ